MTMIKEYLDHKFSVIPINESKIPFLPWKRYQKQKANAEEIGNWLKKYKDLNIGIVTGNISSLAVLDFDDPSLLPEVEKILPELNKTTRVKTKRGYHFYFSLGENQVKSTNRLFEKKLELKSNGSYVVAPDSLINDHKYEFIIPLKEILPLPKVILDFQREQGTRGTEEKTKSYNPIYKGKKVDCIRQIIERDLQNGERNISLFVLYNLLVQNRNKKGYAESLVNRDIQYKEYTLTREEIQNIYARSYKYSCIKIREMLPFITCTNCKYKFGEGGEMKRANILLRNIRRLHKISNTQRGILCLLGTTFNGDYPTISEIEKNCKMNYQTIRKSLLELQEMGIIDPNIYK